MSDEPGYRGWPITLYLDSAEVELAVTRVSDVGGDMDIVDVTSQISPDNWKEKLKGLRDAGRFTMEFNGRPGTTSDETMITDFEDDDWTTIGIKWPDDQYWEADGGTTSFKLSGGIGDKLSGTVTIELTGAWDFDATAPTGA